MGSYIFILGMVITGILLLWLGSFLFFGSISPLYSYLPWNKKKVLKGKPGAPQVCPICGMKLLKRDLIKTVAFAPGANNTDRLMHIKGCMGCLQNGLPRKCPVCGAAMSLDDYLISRMFERRFAKNHVHIQIGRAHV